MFHESRSLWATSGVPSGWLPDLHDAALCTGTGDICQLWLNGRLVVAALNTVVGETAQPVVITLDPAAGPAAATVFLGRMLFDGLDRGDSTYVFGSQTATWATDWLPTNRPSYRLTHFAGFKPRAQLLRLNELRKRWWINAPQTTTA